MAIIFKLLQSSPENPGQYVLTHWTGVLTNFFPVLDLDFLLSHGILAPSREMPCSLSLSEISPDLPLNAEHR